MYSDATRLTPAAERVLDAASALFYANGIHAVGVESIAARAGVTKKTLYDRFGSKDALIAAYLARRDERWRRELQAAVDQAGDPRQAILAVFDAHEEWMRRNPRGCAFVNAHAELPDADHPGRAIIAAEKKWLLDYFTGLAAEAGFAAPESLAGQLLLLHEGATVASSLGTVPDAVAMARGLAVNLLESSGEV